jgi:hypothetical protein
MRMILILTVMLTSTTVCWASPGDAQKMTDFRMVQFQSCTMGHDPNNRFGCYTWMK